MAEREITRSKGYKAGMLLYGSLAAMSAHKYIQYNSELGSEIRATNAATAIIEDSHNRYMAGELDGVAEGELSPGEYIQDHSIEIRDKRIHAVLYEAGTNMEYATPTNDIMKRSMFDSATMNVRHVGDEQALDTAMRGLQAIGLMFGIGAILTGVEWGFQKRKHTNSPQEWTSSD